MNQDLLTYFAWLVIALLLSAAVLFVVWLGSQPGKIARRRNHPHAEAIEACSWVGLLLGGVGWAVALVWAFFKPAAPGRTAESSSTTANDPAEIKLLTQRVRELESQIAKLTQTGGQAR